MATNKPQNEYMKTALRLPAPLHAQLHEAAVGSGRSYNAEIVARLTESLDRPASPDLDVFTLVSEINKGISQTVTKAGFTIELKVTRNEDPSEGKYMPSREHYDKVMKAGANSTKKE